MFEDIYKANLRHLRLEDIAFHLLEEVGEVSNAMARMYTYVGEQFQSGEPSWRQIWLENEIADVTSWLFTLVNSLESMPRIAREFEKYLFEKEVTVADKITLSRIIWNRYGSNDLNKLWCPHGCEKTVCKCPILLVSTDEDFAKFRSYAIDVLNSSC